MGPLRSTDAAGRAHRLPGYGAVVREDVADARRRRPDATLSAWASARGLDALGSQNAAGYFAVLPLDAQLQFNVVRGALPGGRDGCLFHWLRPWPVGMDGEPSGTGRFAAHTWNPGVRSGWWKKLIPLVGDLIDPGVEQAIGVPCTVAATNVPEAARHDGLSAEQEALLRAAIGTAARHPLFELRLRYGTLTAVRNGWPAADDALDELAEAVCHAGDALRDHCLRGALPQPFSAELPAVDWPASGLSLSGASPSSPWLEALHALAAELALTLEEPAAVHAAFPSVPVPGRAFAVLRGKLPGGRFGRLAFHQERTLSDNQGRTALLLEAAPGAAQTEPWGVRNAAPGLTYAVHDGIVALWTLRSSGRTGDLGDVAGFLQRALAFAAERELAAD